MSGAYLLSKIIAVLVTDYYLAFHLWLTQIVTQHTVPSKEGFSPDVYFLQYFYQPCWLI